MKENEIHPYTLKFAQWLLDEHGEYVLWKLVLCGILFVPLFIAMVAFAVLGGGDDVQSESDEKMCEECGQTLEKCLDDGMYSHCAGVLGTEAHFHYAHRR